jgi:transcriptional regulator with XRE-family HTH domain
MSGMDAIAFVRSELAARRGEWIHIARAADVSYRALGNVMHGRNDPRVSTVDKLANWLKANPREREAA